MRTLLLSGVALCCALPAYAAPIEIINFAAPLSSDFVATNPTASTTHLSVSNVTVTISGLFDNPLVTSGLMNLSADNTDAATTPGGIAIQHFSGNFSITDATGTINYLSGNFTDAALGALGGDGLTINVANPPEALTLSSSVIPATDLVPPTAFDLSMSALAPPLSVDAGGSIAAFTASYTGDASSNVAAVPEPASLGLLGLGVLGLAVVRRRG